MLDRLLRRQHNSVAAGRRSASLALASICVAGLLAAFAAVGCRQRATPEPQERQKAATDTSAKYAFEDIASRSGITAVFENGEENKAYSIVESVGGGLGVFDFDRDGRLDVWFPGGGKLNPAEKSMQGLPTRLFRQSAAALQFVEASAAARVDAASLYTHGCSMADCDNDGFTDVLVSGYGGLQFFRNLGDGTFVECAQSVGLTDTGWSSSTAWGDFDRNGSVDLYVAHYVDWSWENQPTCFSPPPERLPDVCPPARFHGLDDTIYFSDGEGHFREANKEAGLVKEGKGLGVVVADVDLDDDVDIYVANDTTENFLYSNDGDGHFEENGLISGTALDQHGTPNGSMGLAVFDFDGNGQPDIWVTNFESETFNMYRNQGQGNFQCITESTGITAIGTLYVGFGTSAVDIELDGDEDLVVANGHVHQHPPHGGSVAQNALLLINDAHGHLIKQDLPDDSYFGTQHRGRSVVSADFNRDGLCDLVFSHVREPASLLLNASDRHGKWIALELVGRSTNRDAIGARVELAAGGRSLLRQVVGGGGYLSQAPYTLHWGLPVKATTADAVIHWPDGQVQKLSGLELEKTHQLVQPANE